jgi:hypothetical protein
VEELERRLVPSTINVLGYHFDNANDGSYQLETTLTPTNVNLNTFGKLFTTQLDGKVYAEPIYKFDVNITRGPHQGIHNVVYVATEHDSLYAIDADNGQILWQDSFISPTAGINPVPNSDVHGAINPEVGITGTPVIDPTTNTIYLDATTKETATGKNHYVHRLWAVQLTDGSNRFGSPVLVADTILNSDGTFTYVSGPTVNGNGNGSINGKLTFNAERQMQRPGLTLVNGTVYVGYGSYFDGNPYHGWILGFNHANANKLRLVAAFNATPNGFQGAFWQGGGRISADSAGNLYVQTGNGTFDTTLDPTTHLPVQGDYGNSFIKLAADPTTSSTHQSINGWGLKVVDYFTPFNVQTLNDQDLDIGSTAPVLLPNSVGTPGHPLLMGGGKEGRIYLVDRSNMGKFDPNVDHIPDERLFSGFSTWGTSAFFNNQLYVVGAGSSGQTFSIVNNKFSNASSQSQDSFSYPGSTPYISANGTRNGIVWDLDQGSGELRAYNAASYHQELYTTSQNSARDQLGSIPTFAVPTVARGRVYVGTTSNTLVTYGLLPHTITGAAAASGTSTLSDDVIQALAGLASTTERASVPPLSSPVANSQVAPLNQPIGRMSNLAEPSRTGSGQIASFSARLHKLSSSADSFWETF